MRLPFNIVPTKKWVAFRAPLPKGEHRIIIIKKLPEEVQYLYVTSQVNNVKRVMRYDLGSIANLFKCDWDSLTEDESCVQCDKKHLGTILVNDFEKLYNDNKVDYIGEVPDIVKIKINAAICSSKSFTETEKKFYTL
ncbi:MAG: hypothetical protein J6J35_07990 [Alphaproteobacteria bacterium]|nr:hypothetical protein [Alphaproteobacteria bacterium]